MKRPSLNDDEYKLNIGTVRFFKSTRQNIRIYYIEIIKNQQRKGYFVELLDYIMIDPAVRTLSVLACSNHRIEYILYKKGFTNIGGDFIGSKEPMNTKGINKNLIDVTYENYIAVSKSALSW
jgi:hypothetical protein